MEKGNNPPNKKFISIFVAKSYFFKQGVAIDLAPASQKPISGYCIYYFWDFEKMKKRCPPKNHFFWENFKLGLKGKGVNLPFQFVKKLLGGGTPPNWGDQFSIFLFSIWGGETGGGKGYVLLGKALQGENFR